jgi:hypothetical protein
MKKTFTFALLFLIFSSFFSYAQYPGNFTFIKVPDPLSGTNPPYSLANKALPNLGETFFDLSFGTMITRTTDANYIHGRHEYSRFDPFNKDKSMIILDPDALWNIYSTDSFPYNQPSNLIRTINLEEPRWDPIDKNLLWGTEEFTIKLINVATGQTTVVKDFSQDAMIRPIISQGNVYRITMMDEGESSIDKRYWAFFIQGNELVDYNHLYIFTWDKDNDSVLGLYNIPSNETKLDWIGMSPLGNWVLIGGDYDNGGNLAGLTMANKELTQFHRLDYTTAHSDVGLDIAGNEVIIIQNTMTDYIDLIPIDLNTQPILEAGGSYDNTNRTPLVRLFYSNESPYGMRSGIHISCNVAGYCVVSTFIEPGQPEQNWLDRTVILIKLDNQNPEAYYLTKLYNTAGSYWEETQATITNDGSKIAWASNWGHDIGNEQVFLMQLDMPPNWKELVTAIDDKQKKIFDSHQLNKNYPNPFNSFTIIQYQLTKSSHVWLKVFNVLGRHVKTLVDKEQTMGSYSFHWDAKDELGKDVASGVYFYQLYAQNFVKSNKMLLLR